MIKTKITIKIGTIKCKNKSKRKEGKEMFTSHMTNALQSNLQQQQQVFRTRNKVQEPERLDSR
jgi:hypothetical protein